MHRPRLVTEECDGWYLVEATLARRRLRWDAMTRARVRQFLPTVEQFIHGEVPAWLITTDSIHLLLHLGKPPALTDEQVLERMSRLAHPLTCRRAQLAWHLDPRGAAWKTFRDTWANPDRDLSKLLPWLGARILHFQSRPKGKLWRDRMYSHPVDPADSRPVRLYLAALAEYRRCSPENALASRWERTDDLQPEEIATMAGSLRRGIRFRRPAGIFGRFGVRETKRRLRGSTRSNEDKKRAMQAHRRNLARFLNFHDRVGHHRVWESPAHADLLPWLRRILQLRRCGRLPQTLREALDGKLPSGKLKAPRKRHPEAPPPLAPLASPACAP